MLHVNPDTIDSRRARILDAAEACFVRAGFHRTTMQDVAAEAGMSAGNLYRYFDSKDAMVEGLCGRDRRDLAADFAGLDADFMAGFLELGRKHFQDAPRDKAVMCLQIWAEASRSPAIGRIVAEFEADMSGRLVSLLRQAQTAGQIPADLDLVAVASLIGTIADGTFVRRAILPDFDPDRETPRVLKLIGAIVSGAVPGLCRRNEETGVAS